MKNLKSVIKRALILAFLIPLALCRPVGAVLSDDLLDYYNINGIYYYNPQGGDTLCYSGGVISGDTIMAKVVSYLKGNNPTGFVLSDNGIAGILANFQAESGFNPFRYQNDKQNGPAYGIAQFDGGEGVHKEKIWGPLRSDPRTANYFDEYHDLKYTKYDSATGFPKEPVPMEVIDAWLSVQLDFFFDASSEFENTKVGTFRNSGGSMGLSYISSSMTAHEAMDAAQSPEDAARIFVWIMERPKNKESAANGRAANAAGWLDYVQRSASVLSNSGGETTTTTSNTTVDGSKITIIGDSITNGSRTQLEQRMPSVDIYAQDSKQFYLGTSDNPGGITILKELVEQGKLRDTLVYALGTNGNFTKDQAQEVVDLAGSSRKVIFVTNWTTSDDYTANNNVITEMKNSNNNVHVADWKSAIESQADTYLGDDGIHPSNPDGRELFARIIASAVGASGELLSACASSMGLVEGGMDQTRAQKLADYYNGPEVDITYWNLPMGTKKNCVSFTAFFVQRFTSIGRNSRAWGDGRNTAHQLAQSAGLPEGNEPRPYAVFSVTQGRSWCEGGTVKCGHTGIVVGVEGDTVITIEASWSSTNPSYAHDARVKTHDLSYFVNTKWGYTFTYLDSILNTSDLTLY